jgi:hypothetical protein
LSALPALRLEPCGYCSPTDSGRTRCGESSSGASITRRRLVIFTKGGKFRHLPIVEAAFWDDLGRHIIEWEAQPDEYLLYRRSLRPNRHKAGERFVTEYRDQPMGVHGLHK